MRAPALATGLGLLASLVFPQPAKRVDNGLKPAKVERERASGAGLHIVVAVQVTPDNGPHPDPTRRVANTTGNQVAFTVTNTGDNDTRYSATCTGLGNVLSSVTCTSIGILVAGQSKVVTATFSTGVAGSGSVQLTATAVTPTGASATGKWDETIVNPAATVTPDGAAAVKSPNTASSFGFTLTNTGTATTTFSLVTACSGTGVAACSPSPASATLAPNGSQTITANFTAQGAGTTGLVELQAKVGSLIVDKGSLNVTVPPSSDAAAVSPPGVLARAQCLTIALASSAASECGDLRIVHALPSVRTMNRWRTPTLLYTSAQALGWVSLGANVSISSTSQAPTTVTADLKINNASRATGSWTGSQWTPGTTRRIALGFAGPAVGLSTGVYDYSLEITKVYADSTPKAITSGKLIIVDRSTSYFGAGWWLAGLEQWNPATAVWIGGDGSARQYTLRAGSVTPNRVWGAPSVTYPDSIREVGSEFVRQLPDSVWVYFDVQGRHVRTRNRQGHVTSFSYDQSSGKLTTVTLPPSTSPLSYSFNYDGNGRVTTVVAPGVPSSRTTTLTINASTGRLTSVLEPDGRTVGFGYGSDNKITSRTDRRGTATSFQFDPGNHVSAATVYLVPDSIKRTLQQAGSQGFSGASVPVSQVFTRLDGPRSGNTVSFYLNGLAAPDSIIDALGQRTRLYRGNSSFPGLATELITVTGHTILTTYDGRARILTSSEPRSSGQTATTNYQWDSKWDQVTRITNPQGDLVDLGVDATTGNLTWIQDGRGVSTRTQFQYFSTDNQIASVTRPNSNPDSYAYDAKGNLQSYFSALDREFISTNNDIGLTTQIQTPTGDGVPPHPGWPPFLVENVTYSPRNEDTQRVMSLSGESVTINKVYDEEGNLTSLTRTFAPNPAGIAALTTNWVYDRANRPTRETEPDGTYEQRWFNPAGSLDSILSRRGIKVVMIYDALERLSSRVLPSVTYSLPASQISPATQVNTLPYSYTWSADNQTFQYAPDGQISLATNKDASITRTFAADGSFLTEALGIKSTDRQTTHYYTTTHTYDLNGRLSSITAPTAFTGVPISYTYSTQWGGLTGVTDIGANSFSFGYNDRGELTGITYGGAISETLGYDGDGRLNSDVITNGGAQAFPRYPGAQLRNFSVTTRNARDQIESSSDAVQADQVAATYSGLGHLLTSNLHQSLVVGETGAGATYASGDATTYDGLGNIITTSTRDSLNFGSGWSVTAQTGANGYNSVGRLSAMGLGGANSVYSYDASGNTYFQARTFSPNVTDERAAYYSPDEKVVATDTRATGRRTLEEYRYDALGRRVWVKSVLTCEPSGTSAPCNTPFVRRTIWDGAQELAEIQVPVDPANPQNEELDTGYPIVTRNTGVMDPNPFFGRVVYGPGLGNDQPLSVTRYDYRDQPVAGGSTLTWPRFTWQVYWNYQGLPTYGTLTTGAWANPYQLGQNQTSCPNVGDQTTQRCVLVQWPLMHSAYDQNRGGIVYPSWHGSLLEGKLDRSGLQFKRNRQYDPKTGRFTQEDPLGLAGGFNLYGFANGDPLTFADPFGLKLCFAAKDRDKAIRTLEQATGSKIDVDPVSGCATGIQRTDFDPKFAMAYWMLERVVEDENRTVTVEYNPFGDFKGGDLLIISDVAGRAYVGFDKCDWRSAHPPAGLAPAMAAREKETVEMAVHHELRHAFDYVNNNYGKPNRDEAEERGVRAEDWYAKYTKQPYRCYYYNPE